MPASEPQRSTTGPTRRAFRLLPSEDELAKRRERGEISCAECKRLKLKCNRVIPCAACVRRGHGSICPNGTVSSGWTTKHNRNHPDSDTTQRIRDLEQALADLQAKFSSERHPLLNHGTEKNSENSSTSPPSMTEQLASTTAAFGTLAIGNSGNAAYFGSSAGTESLYIIGAEISARNANLKSTTRDEFQAEEHALNDEIEEVIAGGVDLFLNPAAEPGHSEGYLVALEFLLRHLPDRLRSSALCEAYDEHFSWIVRPQTREQNLTYYIIPAYSARDILLSDPGSESWTDTSPHMLSALFSIFSMGALGDLTLPSHNAEAERYHRLARAALQLRHLLAPPSLDTVYAILMLAHYQVNSGKLNSMDSSWILVSLASNVGQSLGLHRDCTQWNMDNKTIQRRRRLWWESYTANVMMSIHLGRPISVHHIYVDCPLPDSDTDFYHLKYTLIQQIMVPVLETMVAANPPTYDKILELDRRVRNYTLPDTFLAALKAESVTGSGYMRTRALDAVRGLCTVIIHRNHFARALLDFPLNPLLSPFAPSFLAVYRCSSWTIKMTSDLYTVAPDLCTRWWQFWQQLFNSGIIVASIISRSPGCAVAPTAFVELTLVVDLFEKAAVSTLRARSGLALLRKLRRRAQQIYYAYRSHGTEPEILPDGHPRDVVSLFGGQTRLLDSATYKASLHPGETTPMYSSAPREESQQDPGPSSLPSEPFIVPDIHPSLEQFMGFFPASAFAPGFDISGNSVTSASVPRIPIELETYSYPPFSLDMAQNQSLLKAFDFDAGTNIGNTLSPDISATYESTIFDGIAPIFSGFKAQNTQNSQASSNLDDFMMDLMPDMGVVSDNDQQWRSFLAESGIATAFVNSG